MTLVTKTVLKEHIGPFFSGVATIVFVFLLNVVFRDLGRLLGKGLPVKVVFEFFYLNMAWILALAVPMSVLLASLMAFGRLSSDNEITALKASGVHFFRLLSPVLVAATVLTFLMVLFNNNVLPEFNHRWRQLYAAISQTRPTLSLEEDVFFNEVPNYTLLVHHIKDKNNELEGIVVNDSRDPKFNKTIVAERGQFLFIKEEGRMVLTLVNGEIHEIEKDRLENYRRMKFEKQTFSLAVSDAVLKRINTENRGDREKTAGMIRRDIRERAKILSEHEQNIRDAVKSDLASIFPDSIHRGPSVRAISEGNAKEANSVRIERLVQTILGEKRVVREYKRQIHSLEVEFQKKYSIPFACLIFVLVGAPLGVMIRQSGIATAGWMSIVFYMIYWSFLIGGEQLADRMLLNPAVAMWAPNAVVGIAGVLLVIRTTKETSFGILAGRLGLFIRRQRTRK
jgi:lipopolysaccharide export system permease protein